MLGLNYYIGKMKTKNHKFFIDKSFQKFKEFLEYSESIYNIINI